MARRAAQGLIEPVLWGSSIGARGKPYSRSVNVPGGTMAIKRVHVRFYSLHVRSGADLIDYRMFFEALTSSVGSEVEVAPDYTVVMQDPSFADPTSFQFVLYGGDPAGQVVFYDLSEGGPVVEAATKSRWSAKATRVLVEFDTDRRVVALESSRGGVTALLLERFLERVSLPDFPERRVEITPLASRSFLQEIDEFERIRLASIEVARPNYDWIDHANKLYQLAEESNAESSVAGVKAARGESLAKESGLVSVIRKVFSKANPSIRNAKITGRKPGDVVDKTISLDQHQERSAVTVDQKLPLDEQNDSLFSAFKRLASRLGNARLASDEVRSESRSDERP